MSNVQLTDKDDWLCLLLFPSTRTTPPPPNTIPPFHPPQTKKKKKILIHRHGRLMIADCLIVSLIRLLAKLSVITARGTGHYRREMRVASC